jgi:hypothetical protein
VGWYSLLILLHALIIQKKIVVMMVTANVHGVQNQIHVLAVVFKPIERYGQ